MTRYAALLLLAATGLAQTDWPSYGNDPGAMRYSALRQIDVANVGRLKPAWTFRTDQPGSEAVPVVVSGVMYVTAPDGVYALVPETGELLWKYDVKPVALRGLAYWPGTHSLHPRVFTGNGHFLLAIDVTTGKPAPGFGDEGRVDLKPGVLGDLRDGRYDLQSPPAVFGDVVITGCSMFTTGYGRDGIIHEGRLDRGVQLITKPFTFSEFADKIRKVFEMTGKGTILLVEDEALIAAVTAETLRDLGFKVEEAATAAAALAFAQSQTENLAAAIVDINLPDGKGDELAKKLRALKPDLPIVIATGAGDKALAGDLKKGAPLALLSKPYDSNGLRKSLATVGLG